MSVQTMSRAEMTKLSILRNHMMNVHPLIRSGRKIQSRRQSGYLGPWKKPRISSRDSRMPQSRAIRTCKLAFHDERNAGLTFSADNGT
jgi:hypothetical protein